MFKATIASSPAQSCAGKRLGVANNGKVTALWNKEMNNAIQAKNVACKAWLQNKAASSLHVQYAEERKSTALTMEKSKMESWENFEHILDYW